MKKSPLNNAKWANRDPGTNMTQKEKLENRDMYKSRTNLGNKLLGVAGMGLQAFSIPSALIAEGYEAYTGKGDGKFNFGDAMPKMGGFMGDKGTQKEVGNLMYPDADWKKQMGATLLTDPTTLLGGSALVKGLAKVGGKLTKVGGKSIKNLKSGAKQIKELEQMKKIGKFNMPHSPLNYKDEFDIDYSGAKAVDLGNIPASDFTKAKKKLVEGYGGPNNPDYRMDKGDLYWSKEKGKIRSGYTEYPEDAGNIDPRYLGKNWDNAPMRQSSQEGGTRLEPQAYEEVYNMTPDATQEESKAVRDKFDNTYLKNREPYPGYFKEKSDRAKEIESEYGDVMGEGGKSLINKPWKLLTSNKYNYPRWEGQMMDAGIELGKNLLIPGRFAKKAKKAWDLKQINKNKNIY